MITGAASGIGEALARELAARGSRLMLADIDAPRLEGLAAELRAAGADCDASRCDSGDEAALMVLAEHTERRFGAADVLVNNAGVVLVAPVQSLQARDAHWLIVHPGGIRTAISRNARIVDLAMVADSPEQMHSNFERNARTTPREAALQILGAIGRRRLCCVAPIERAY